jgi:hypothetical protein
MIFFLREEEEETKPQNAIEENLIYMRTEIDRGHKAQQRQQFFYYNFFLKHFQFVPSLVGFAEMITNTVED